MNIHIKQIKEGQQIIFPQTSAEAVLINSNQKVITLNDFVNKKTTINVNGKIYSTISGHEDQHVKLSDDFSIDNETNSIKLTWNGTT